jgi:hypothetical protein
VREERRLTAAMHSRAVKSESIPELIIVRNVVEHRLGDLDELVS